MTTTLPPPALRTTEPFASPVTIGANRGAWTAERLPIPDQCACAPGVPECLRCFLDADAAFARSQDI